MYIGSSLFRFLGFLITVNFQCLFFNQGSSFLCLENPQCRNIKYFFCSFPVTCAYTCDTISSKIRKIPTPPKVSTSFFIIPLSTAIPCSNSDPRKPLICFWSTLILKVCVTFHNAVIFCLTNFIKYEIFKSVTSVGFNNSKQMMKQKIVS